MDEDRIQNQARDADEQSTQRRASILGVSYLDTRSFEDTLDLVPDVLSVDEMHKNRIVPLVKGAEAEPWQFGITTQSPQSYLKELANNYATNAQNVRYYLISQSAFKVFMERYDPPVKVVYDDIKIASEGDSETISEVSKNLESVSTNEIFDFLISQAERLGASDIHVENQRSDIRIRMRVDGALHPVATLDQDRYRVIIGALASRSNLSTASEEPQSGHMQQEVGEGESRHLLNMRIEMIPTMYGQDAVIRLFNYDDSMLNLERLRIGPNERSRIDDIISHPRGMVLMVGPTGSGKSTTLYSMINALNSPNRKIITLEDPVEFSVPGITQVPVNTTNGQSFADHLRSVLRLDPDVVMIGEIRDADTAKTAIQASITGHLVLSTFHATDASAAFSRMVDLIGMNPIFSSAIRLVIAQRLVRRLDDSTKEAYEPDEATKEWVRGVLKDLPSNIERPNLNDFQLYRAVPGEASPFGYNGRVVIMEQLVVSDDMEKIIRGEVADIDTSSIEKTARKNGMVTLLQQGVLAVLRGETTIEEINRVI